MRGAIEEEPVMLDLLTRAEAAGAATPPTIAGWAAPYFGPERRNASLAGWRWLSAALDEIDYGIVLIGADGRVQHANQVALAELDAQHPLLLSFGELRARRGADAQALLGALHDAQRRGLRRLLTLGEGAQQVSASVVPLAAPGGTLVILGKRQVSAELAVQGFARLHGLTGGEARVLAALCGGLRPAEVASAHGVALSTVRSQIGSIRLKTGAASIRDLLAQVARLPPLMGRLRSGPERLGSLLQGLARG
jgi:DNA-binding CsgD family transcriptional regulator